MLDPVASPDIDTEPRWGLGEVILGLGLAFVGASLTSGLALAVSGEEDFDDLSLAWLVLAQVGLWGGLFGASAWAAITKGRGIVGDYRLRATWSDIGIGALVGAVLQLLVIPLVYLPLLELTDQTRRDVEEPARELTDRADGLIGPVLLVLIVAVAAPIVEELFYRGLFQRALLKRGVPAAAAIGINAFVFAGSHFQLLQLPALFLFGASAGWLAYRRGRLGPAIAAHVVFNLVTVVALLA